jgi:histone arginine demethylase JMJD6
MREVRTCGSEGGILRVWTYVHNSLIFSRIETCFIPHGWWHAVLNLTHTVGVTQNFCSERNFDQVWLKTRSGRKHMAWKWLQQLDLKYPHLAERARHLNERDHFRMKYDPEILRKRDGEDKRQQKKRKSFSSL